MIFEAIPKYPHMLPAEREIWHRFIRTREAEFLSLTYDLHLGEGIPPPPDASEQVRKVIEATSKKRVDAIGETDRDIWIFEVKERGGMSALGQLLTYRYLYMKEYRPTKPVRLALVCSRLEPDVSSVLQAQGIEIYVV